jgi:glutamate-1-semialdehyde 2,1-aminomutase
MLRDACAEANVDASFPVVGTLAGMYFGNALGGKTPTNFQEACTTSEETYAKVFHALLSAGVALAPGAYESLFVGLAHTDEVVAQLAERVAVGLQGINR